MKVTHTQNVHYIEKKKKKLMNWQKLKYKLKVCKIKLKKYIKEQYQNNQIKIINFDSEDRYRKQTEANKRP